MEQLMDIRDALQMKSLADFVKESQQVDEGIKEVGKNVLDFLKRKFVKVIEWFGGLVAKLNSKQSYWCPLDENGDPEPAITPLTAGQAFADGVIGIMSTLVYLSSPQMRRLTGCNTKPSDAKKLYGSGNTLDYWFDLVNESELGEKPINEVKLHNSDPQAAHSVVDTPALKKIISAHLKNPKLPRLLIMGAPGIGKTAILNSVLNEIPGGKEFSLIVKTLSNETPENFALPKYVEVDGQTKATDIPKTWMPVYAPTGDPKQDAKLDAACGKGLLFIDELSRAQPQVLNVILPLINEGVFNGWKMGSGWQIICASNRAEDELSGQANISNALANRFNIVYYEPTVKSWEEWAKTQNYMSPLLLTWLNLPSSETMSGGKYFYWDPNEEGDDPSMIMCTPRAWTNAMRTLAVYADTADLEGFSILDIPKSLLALALNTSIPSQAVDSFLAFLDVIRSVGNFDAAVEGIWSGSGFDINKRDLNKVALPFAQLLITSHKTKLPTTEEFDNLATWLVKQGSDQMASYVLDIFKNVYAPGLESFPSLQDGIFILARKWETVKDDKSRAALFINGYDDDFLKPWKVTMDTMPDYSIGLQKLSKKFGAIFKKYTVDGVAGLG